MELATWSLTIDDGNTEVRTEFSNHVIAKAAFKKIIKNPKTFSATLIRISVNGIVSVEATYETARKNAQGNR